jgi:predicted RNA binding protein YcfA (HicA-like mRNA interferase family)
MAKTPVLKPKEVIGILEKLGFVEIRQRGPDKQFRHNDGRATTVPVHSARDISPILLRQIIKNTGITLEEFLDKR